MPEALFPEWGEETTIPDAVFQALGYASACWTNLEGAGIFEAEKAQQIGAELIAFLQAKGPYRR